MMEYRRQAWRRFKHYAITESPANRRSAVRPPHGNKAYKPIVLFFSDGTQALK